MTIVERVLTGQGPAGLVPGQKRPPAGIPFPYTSCAAVVPSADKGANGLCCRRLEMSQETVAAPPAATYCAGKRKPASYILILRV